MAKPKKDKFKAISENPMKSAWMALGFAVASLFVIPYGFAGVSIGVAVMGLMAPGKTNTVPHKKAVIINYVAIVLAISSFVLSAVYSARY